MPNASNWASEREIAFLTGENGIQLNCGTLTVSGVWTKTPAQKLQILLSIPTQKPFFHSRFVFDGEKNAPTKWNAHVAVKLFC